MSKRICLLFNPPLQLSWNRPSVNSELVIKDEAEDEVVIILLYIAHLNTWAQALAFHQIAQPEVGVWLNGPPAKLASL
ncbi:MAG TPA: hypothetical protein VFS76_15805 [Pyrinomonadaceae bacterium]|nr:hypothetical protein [Pyrinomonadaceae bacterium]